MNTDTLQPEGGWTQPAAPRLQAPPLSERGALFRAVSRLSGLFGRAEVPDVLTVLHINSRLFWPWLLFASRLMPYGRLAASDREKIILRTAWNCRSRYEWGQHVQIALAVGVSDAEIVKVAQGPGAFQDRHEKALMQACDEIFHSKCIADQTWAILAEQFRQEVLIEIVMLVGHYEMIAGFLNSSGIVLEPAMEKVLQAFQQRLTPRAGSSRTG